MATSLSIIVNRGDPCDLRDLRHTSLYLEFPDHSTIITHVVGAHGFFKHEEKPSVRPHEDEHFERLIRVTDIKALPQAKESIRYFIGATPVNNSERSWNCQSWVGDALKRLQGVGWISEQAVGTAVVRMVDVLLEAPYE